MDVMVNGKIANHRACVRPGKMKIVKSSFEARGITCSFLNDRLKDKTISMLTVKELMNEINEAKNNFNRNRGSV